MANLTTTTQAFRDAVWNEVDLVIYKNTNLDHNVGVWKIINKLAIETTRDEIDDAVSDAVDAVVEEMGT